MFSQGFVLIKVHVYIHLLTPCYVFHQATCKSGEEHLELAEPLIAPLKMPEEEADQ